MTNILEHNSWFRQYIQITGTHDITISTIFHKDINKNNYLTIDWSDVIVLSLKQHLFFGKLGMHGSAFFSGWVQVPLF